ncbi:M23 family metallopeptidase [Rhodobacter capsulatus]|uniref:Peptidase, M23 family n=1 Tax=Rhodobacter capsulatus (strain ATCC BAA-309 / NBRC 16581 / SB1003) TaxID=272942 RepID=D5APY6_RHOCB|nr:M23 family metallopeptidase [Rhodobacter capsulatus]ADE86705.1 peptidase, M23 family [Rhodobacter capsulatus SB 1003]ETD00272.1 peptidase M24 [Rhodobacter capsulatus DE442]ETD74612.1 peptidase M24 [Rhodobacter capsulatus R121]ETE52476.1 peptidase M24 [Rhodobacter capsulatus Y262]MDS0928506.1 M23 family metallopeptidase [Rhodobacter capsulatus]
MPLFRPRPCGRRAPLLALALGLAALPGAVPAQDIVLKQPIACTLGETCYIQHYVDHGPGPELRDFGCGTASYQGHDGTDFALPTLAAMAAGVDVLAAAPGRVRAIRDGEADGAFAAGADVAGKDCGNGVLIEHGGGWQTQYCHLKQGSIAVKPGTKIAAGTRLGQVGMSGRAEFPHLHLALRHDGLDVDPFQPDPAAACDPAPRRTLWQDPPAYVGGGLLQAALSDAPPDFAAVKAGLTATDRLPADAPALVLWAYGYDSRKGDVVTLTITGPEGFTFTHEEVLERPQALFFRYAGKRAPAGGFAPGRYEATVTQSRDGAEIGRKEAFVILAAP